MSEQQLANSFRQIIETLNLEIYDHLELEKTSLRLAELYKELFSGAREDPSKTIDSVIPIASSKEHSVVQLDHINFYSMCMHHWLPFFGQVNILFKPDVNTVGIGKVSRLVHVLARRPQLQEYFTASIATILHDKLAPHGLVVIVEARQMCLEMRGTPAEGSVMRTIETRGTNADIELLLQLAKR